MIVTCHVCKKEFHKRPSKVSKVGRDFCGRDCLSEWQITAFRNEDAIKRFKSFLSRGIGYNEACRKSRISKFTASRIVNGFYDEKTPHSKFRTGLKTGIFDVYEMEWL